jgi:hypothetical protein
MRSSRQSAMLVALIVAGGLAMAPPHAGAGTIDVGVLVGGPGLGSASVPSVSTTTVNNDDLGAGTENTVGIQKSFGSIDPIDILFQATNSVGTTEYRVTETITNSTAVIWFDYHLEFGFGGFAGTPSPFVQSELEDKLDFDTCFTLDCDPFTPAPTSTTFGAVVAEANELAWSGGAVSPGKTVTFVFSIDVPESADCSVTVPACPVVGEAAPTGFLFTLREFPTITGPVPPPDQVPGPATLLLVGSGVAGLRAVTWRRRRS